MSISKILTKASRLIGQLPARTYLLLAIIIFAASSSVIRKLTQIGALHLINGRNPISFCNTLFAGNICALIFLIFIYRKQWSIQNIKYLSAKNWLALITVAILEGALAPALIFTALSLTMVNNVVLIGRIEPPLTLALSVLLLRERVNIWVVAGAIASFLGVVLTIALQPSGGSMVNIVGMMPVGKGEVLAVAWAVCIAISTIINKVNLRQIPLGIFTIFRTFIGTVIFCAIVLKLFGLNHFIDVFSPLLWQWMLLYSVVIVVGGQLCFFSGLKKASASDISLTSSFSPIAGILAAYLILGESPNMAQYIGGSVIMCGIVLNQIGVLRQTAEIAKPPKVMYAKEMENSVGFKGI